MGCIGGLGLTERVLVCMVILAGIAPGHAVKWVCKHYDPATGETPEQEDWVLWFAGRVSQKPK